MPAPCIIVVFLYSDIVVLGSRSFSAQFGSDTKLIFLIFMNYASILEYNMSTVTAIFAEDDSKTA